MKWLETWVTFRDAQSFESSVVVWCVHALLVVLIAWLIAEVIVKHFAAVRYGVWIITCLSLLAMAIVSVLESPMAISLCVLPEKSPDLTRRELPVGASKPRTAPTLLAQPNHHKLRAFELADELAVATYQFTKSFAREEQFGLTSQMRRAAVSVPSNIVEGCAKPTQADYVRFLDIAYGSACEIQYQISLAYRLGFLNQSDFDDFKRIAVETGKVLSGLIRSLRNKPEA